MVVPSKITSKIGFDLTKYYTSVYFVNILFIIMNLPDAIALVMYLKPHHADTEDSIFKQYICSFSSFAYFCLNMLFIAFINYKNRKIVF